MAMLRGRGAPPWEQRGLFPLRAIAVAKTKVPALKRARVAEADSVASSAPIPPERREQAAIFAATPFAGLRDVTLLDPARRIGRVS